MWLFIFGIFAVAVGDRLTKALALAGRSWDVGFFHFIFQPNDALVFSWPAPNWVAVMAMAAALVVLFWLTRRSIQRHDQRAIIGCLCMVVGAISNGYDRIAYGYVVDWAYVGHWFPVFNLADALVAVGVVMVVTRWQRLTNQT